MKLPTIAAVLTLFLPSLSNAQSVDLQLKKLEMQWYDAVAKRDVPTVQRLLADDFSETAPDGHLFTKAQEIASLKSGEDAVSFINTGMKVRVYGDTAVVTYVDTIKSRNVNGTSRWTDTWVKRGGSWQCVSSHGTTIAHP